jgi:uncharacterized membrane protein
VIAIVGYFAAQGQPKDCKADISNLSQTDFDELIGAKHSRFFLVTYALLSATLMGALSLNRFWAHRTNAYDLGIFVNTIYRMAFLQDYHSSVKGGMNLYLDHQSPVLVMFAAMYAALPTVETILIAQSLILASGCFAVFYMVLQYLPGRYF